MRSGASALFICTLSSVLGFLVFCLAFRRLAAPQRLGDDLVAEHDLGVRHILDRKPPLVRLARSGIVPAQPGGVAVTPQEDAPEAPPTGDRDRHLDLDLAAGLALEIGPP